MSIAYALPDSDRAPLDSIRRPLGRSGPAVSPLCLGGNVFGWTVDPKTTFRLLDAWLDAGMNFVDTAHSYSRWVTGNAGGESESLIGQWLATSRKRDRLVLATKVGSDMGLGRTCLSASYIEQAAEASLRRLRTDCIDLYQSHWDDPGTPLEETLEAYAKLIKAGKVRAIGASNLSPARLEQALRLSTEYGLPRYESMQPHYNLCERSIYEGELQRVCVENGLGVLPYYSLASGFLTGKYRDVASTEHSARGSHAARYLDAGGKVILAALDEIAAARDATQAQVALAWLASRPGVAAPIASATTLEQLGELSESARLALLPHEIDRLDRASAALGMGERQEHAA